MTVETVYWSRKDVEVRVIEIRGLIHAIDATDVKSRQLQHFKDIEALARKAKEDLIKEGVE